MRAFLSSLILLLSFGQVTFAQSELGGSGPTLRVQLRPKTHRKENDLSCVDSQGNYIAELKNSGDSPTLRLPNLGSKIYHLSALEELKEKDKDSASPFHDRIYKSNIREHPTIGRQRVTSIYFRRTPVRQGSGRPAAQNQLELVDINFNINNGHNRLGAEWLKCAAGVTEFPMIKRGGELALYIELDRIQAKIKEGSFQKQHWSRFCSQEESVSRGESALVLSPHVRVFVEELCTGMRKMDPRKFSKTIEKVKNLLLSSGIPEHAPRLAALVILDERKPSNPQ